VAVPTRQDVSEYKQLKREVDQLVGRFDLHVYFVELHVSDYCSLESTDAMAVLGTIQFIIYSNQSILKVLKL
jgi:hypothetical protein